MLYMVDLDIKDRLTKVLEKYSLPTSVEIDCKAVLSFIAHDKKASGTNIDIILVNKIGSYEIKTVSIDELANYM